MAALLRLRGVSYAHRDNRSLHQVDFDLNAGEVHALVGDHKAGKSTLARIMAGLYQPDAGSVEIDGVPYRNLTYERARKLGIAVVQHTLQVIPTMNALENVAVGMRRGFFLKRSTEDQVRRRCEHYLAALGISFDLGAPLHTLTEEQQQITELLKAISSHPRVLILDEISSRLVPERLQRLFEILREGVRAGSSIVYITPNIDEVFQIADRVTVLRDGHRIGTRNAAEMDRVRLVQMAFSFTSYIPTDREESTLFVRRYSEDLVQNLPIGALITDVDGMVISANVEARKVIASSVVVGETHIERVLSDLFIAETDEIIEAMERGVQRVWENVAMDTDRHARIACYPVRSYDDQALGSMLFLEDVSTDHFAQEYLARAEQMSTIAEVAAGVAHEINNPLGIIQNYIELLRGSESVAEREEYVATIEGQVSMISEIVGSLLSFSRLKQSPPRTIDPVQLLEEVVLLLNHRLGEKEISVVRRTPREPLHIIALENKIRQLFINLITNAVDAMLAGGTLTLSVTRIRPVGDTRITVEDTGHGIPDDLQARIFDPFFSTKMTKTNVGLGLSVCRNIVELHGGLITFHSRPGKTVFEVQLPQEPDRERLADTAAAQSR